MKFKSKLHNLHWKASNKLYARLFFKCPQMGFRKRSRSLVKSVAGIKLKWPYCSSICNIICIKIPWELEYSKTKLKIFIKTSLPIQYCQNQIFYRCRMTCINVPQVEMHSYKSFCWLLQYASFIFANQLNIASALLLQSTCMSNTSSLLAYSAKLFC